MKPYYERLSEKFVGRCSFYSVDGDSGLPALKLLKDNGIRSVPTFKIYVGGKLVDSVIGAHLDQLEDTLETEIYLSEKRANEEEEEQQEKGYK